MDCIADPLKELAKWAFKLIRHELGYLFFYNNNINDLRDRRSELVNARERLQHEVEQEKNKGNEIEADVSKWLDEANTIINSTDIEGSNPSYSNLFQRHQLSRKAKKDVLKISEMIDKGEKFNRIGNPAPLPGIAISHIPGHQILESRTSKATEIKDALADPNINRVGVYGMGGVGKTRLLKDVEKLVVENKMFDHVVNVTVGQTFSVENIQDQIVDKLRLEYNHLRSKEGKADLLRNKLKMEKRVLIMLDDVWEEVNLEDVGILCRSEKSQEGCKLLITSREDLTNDMWIEKSFHLNPLTEEESKTFFMALIGECKHEVEMVAMEVVKECAGLPIALDVVAKALKGKRLPSWNDALRKLKNNIAVDINGVSKKVYTSLKFSYDFLGNDEIKSLFLLCSVFPDDYQISVKKLQMYAMGMGLLEHVSTWNDARNRVCALVDDLKSSSLLLETDGGDKYVQMHDVVRDVAKHIASNEANMPTLSYGYQQSEWQEKYRSGSYKAIFGDCDSYHTLPQNLEFKKLELLILHCECRSVEEILQISETFFKGMKELKVLVLTWMLVEKFSTSFAHSLQNLRIFCMSYCEVDDIDAIGHLKKLKILWISDCSITCLPATMSGLTELKVLRVSRCSYLEVIPQNVLSSMTKLEELNLWMSFKGWGKELLYKDKLIKNAPLVELKCLPHLTCLKINIFDDMNLPDLMFLKRLELENFSISVGSFDHQFYGYARRTLMLEIKSQSDLIGRVLGSLLLRCEGLILKAAAGITNLGYHGLSQCDNGGNVTSFFHPKVSFPELKNLNIQEGNDPKMLWHNNGLDAHFLSKLQIISITRCNNLRCIFPSNVVMTLVSLERLSVKDCDLLEMIFEMENPTFKHKDGAKMVPLANLSLERLPNLKYVWSKDPNDFLTFPNLREVKIMRCPQLKSVFPTSFTNHLQQLKELRLDEPHQIFAKDATSKSISHQVAFPELTSLIIEEGNSLKMLCHNNGLAAHFVSKLQRISIIRCSGLRCIFSSNVVMPLVSLEILNVEDCNLLEMIFEMENPTFKHKDGAKMVPSTNLSLKGLPNLKYVWSKDLKDFLTFPNLQSVYIDGCPQLESIFPASFINHLQQLKELTLDESYQIFAEDTTSNSISPQVAFSEIEEINSLDIEEGNSLKMLWHNNGLIAHSFSKLGIIHIRWCHNLRCIFPSNVVMSLVSLEILKVEDCDLLEMIFEMEKPTSTEKDDAIIVPLRNLLLNRLPNLKYVWSKDPNDILTFPNLQNVEISDCPQLKSVFPASFINHLQQLKELTLYGSYQIFAEDTTSKSISPQVLFPNMTSLKFNSIAKMVRSFYFTLEAFPRLTHLQLVGSLDYDMITLPSEIYQILYQIEDLRMGNSQLVQIFSNVEENDHIQKYVNLKNFTLSYLPELTHIWKDNPQLTILFDNLEIIDIQTCGKLKCLVPPSTTFLNLTYLSIWDCNELMNLLSSSVAKSLVKLKKMRICYCQGMTSVLAEGDGEKENDEIVFTKLVELEVGGLLRLENFYLGKCMLKFPCLKKLIIKRCPEMKIFSNGIVCMPELRYLKIENEEDSLETEDDEDSSETEDDEDDGEEDGELELSPKHDINVIIHNIWLEEYDGIKQLFTQENEEEDYV